MKHTNINYPGKQHKIEYFSLLIFLLLSASLTGQVEEKNDNDFNPGPCYCQCWASYKLDTSFYFYYVPDSSVNLADLKIKTKTFSHQTVDSITNAYLNNSLNPSWSLIGKTKEERTITTLKGSSRRKMDPSQIDTLYIEKIWIKNYPQWSFGISVCKRDEFNKYRELVTIALKERGYLNIDFNPVFSDCKECSNTFFQALKTYQRDYGLCEGPLTKETILSLGIQYK